MSTSATERHLSRREQRRLISAAVTRRVEAWQRLLISQDIGAGSQARAETAILRRARVDAPGSPDTWSIVLPVVPAELAAPPDGRQSEQALPSERAVHAALVLYAVHTQSATEPRHYRGRRLGGAVRMLTQNEHISNGARGRFTAFATSSSWTQRLHHLRGLISLMRSQGVSLDYGELAADLYELQLPGGIERVRLQWGRDLESIHQADPATSGTSDERASDAATSTNTDEE